MKAAVILKLVSGALQDLEPDCESRWSWEMEEGKISLLDFLNAAIRAVALQRPDAFAVTETIMLEPGMRQSLPCAKKHKCRHNAAMLIELVRNMGADGETPGPAIISANADVLLAFACASRESACIENFAYDRMANPKSYLVYPAAPAQGTFVEATFAVEPCPVIAPEQEIGIADAYAPALKHHILASIFAGDHEASMLQKASWHMQMYSGILGVKCAVDKWWPKAKSSDVPGGG